MFATIQKMNITILDLTQKTLNTSEHIRKTEGLFTNDSLILAAMKHANLTKLATNEPVLGLDDELRRQMSQIRFLR